MTNEPPPLLRSSRKPAAPAAQTRAWRTFRVGDEEYGVEADTVIGVSRPASLALCGSEGAGSVLGVTFVRGAVVPVVEARACDGSAGEPPGELLLIDIGKRRIGVLVDAVGGILRLGPDDVLPAPGFPRGCGTAYVVGIVAREARGPGAAIVLVDLRRWWAEAGARR